MAKAKDLDTWGRSTARKRYADGGDVPSADEAAPNRGDEIDSFINAVMRKQIEKMQED